MSIIFAFMISKQCEKISRRRETLFVVVLRESLAVLAMPDLKFGAFLLDQPGPGITDMHFHMRLGGKA